VGKPAAAALAGLGIEQVNGSRSQQGSAQKAQRVFGLVMAHEILLFFKGRPTGRQTLQTDPVPRVLFWRFFYGVWKTPLVGIGLWLSL
jgi:hypothetical protein